MQKTSLQGYPLSMQQARLWMQQGERSVWYTQCTVRLNGKLDMPSFLSALQNLVQRHDILRTAFRRLSGMEVPVQVVISHLEVDCPVINLEHLSAPQQNTYLNEYLTSLQGPLTHLETHPLFVLALLRLSPDMHLLLLCLPALCADEYTLIRIILELSQMYAASFHEMEQDEEPLQYAEVASWQEQLQQSEEVETLREYWRRINLSQLAAIDLPFAQQKSLAGSGVSAGREDSCTLCAYEVALEESVTAQIRQRAQHYGVSVEAWLLACWEVVLWRLNGMQDSLLGVVCNGRIHEDLTEELVKALGLLTHAIPLEMKIEQDIPFERFVNLVDKALLEAIKRQSYFSWADVSPSDTAIHESPPHFFPLGFEYVEWPIPFVNAKVQFSLYKSSCHFEKFLLKLRVVQSGEHIQLSFQYDPKSSKLPHIEQLASVFQTLLRSGITQPQASVSTLAVLESALQASLLTLGCASTQPISPLGLHQLFEAQVQRYPNCMAVMGLQEQLTYQQLNERANKLAQVLRRRGVGPNVLVGLFLPRQPSMVVGLLGILKAGGAYLPLDGGNPATRLTYQLCESKVTLLLTQEAVRPHVPEWRGSILCLEELEGELAQALGENQAAGSVGEDLAYVIYTSGSTGAPKGVMVRQSSVVNYTQALCAQVKAEPGWQYATVSTLAADLGNTAIFCALASGGCVQVLDYEIITSGEAMAAWAAEHPIDVLKIVPSHLSALLESAQAQVLLPRRALVLGGEALSAQLVEEVRQRGATCQIYNHYGPTETTIGVLVNPLEAWEQEAEGSNVALGRPIANTQVYVLDQRMHLLPAGVLGELYIGGAGLALGYQQQPEQTAERFVPHPYSQQPGERLYRTGDLMYYGENGKVIFVGRRDGQVKLRGYRIEIGEIEAVLRQHPLIWDCAVQLQEEGPGGLRLIGYVVARTADGMTTQDLQEFLREKLPEYMLPASFVLLESLPLTANGKLDRRQLPQPGMSQEHTSGTQSEARSPIEEMIMHMWKEILQLSSLGVHDNFFVLGGHSLLATRVMARLQAMFQVVLPLQMLFEAPTVAELAQRVEQVLYKDERDIMPPLVTRARPEEIPLSFAQQRLWFLDQLEPDTTTYLISRAVSMRGIVDVRSLERSLQEIIHRHEILRTTFTQQAGRPVQVINQASSTPLPVIDLQSLQPEQREEEARRLARQDAQHPCDLASGPLLRTFLLRAERQEYVLLLTLHHIITDGWSNQILVRELTTLYQAFVAGQPSHLAPLSIQYADYALWQRAWLQGEALDAQLVYWRTQLIGAAPLALPTDHPRPAVQSYRGASQELQLPLALSQELQMLSQQEHVTLFMTLLASFQVLLMRYSGQSDISVGTPIANRQQAEIEELIGFFVNTLVLRTDLSGNPSFVEVLRRVREVCLGAYTHQDVPFEQVVEAVEPARDLSRSPLFQVMFSLQNASQQQAGLTDLQIRSLNVENVTSKFDLTLSVEEREHELYATMQYNPDLFEAWTIEQLLICWQTLLAAVVQQPQTSIGNVPLLASSQLAQLLTTTSTIPEEAPLSLCLHFEQQVEHTPDAIALVCAEQQLTYHALNRHANQLAHLLQVHGVGPEVVVGIALERSPFLLIALLAVVKAGGAYLPLEPTSPSERIAELLQEADVWLVITMEDWGATSPLGDVTMLCLDTQAPQLVHQSEANLLLDELPGQLLSLIPTSGSTGRPKGTGITRQGFGSLLNWFLRACELTPQSRILVATASSFDLTQKNLLAPLLAGGSVRLLPAGHYDPQLVCQTIAEQAITFMNCVPTMLYPLLDHERPRGFVAFSSVRQVFTGGETLSMASLLPWLGSPLCQAQVLSAYGPTECTDIVTFMALEQPERYLSMTVPIGRALPYTRLYLLDAWGNLALPGSIGELYVGGEGVARGYLGQAQETAKHFVPDPFSGMVGARLYRTGDLVRLRADETLEFIGRLDQQVKIHGMRIELGEIEAVLRQYPEILDVVVLAREDVSEDKRLVAYVVGQPGVVPTHRELRSWLHEHLPTYMHPSTFVFLDALPLTPNGKVDRRALPAPEKIRPDLAATFVRPGTSIEITLARIWSQVLGVEQVGVHDNFFSLGGDSILGIQVVARARSAGLQLTPRQLFQYQSIAQLASVVTTVETSRTQQGLVTGSVPLTPIQHGFFARQLPEPHHFNQAVMLESLQPLRLLWLQQALWRLILHHDALRLRFMQHAESDWRQDLTTPVATHPFLCVDLSALPQGVQETVITHLAALAQTSLELSAGLLLRALYFRCSDRPGYLLLLIHHLAVDGVSWRILLDDLQTVYGQLARDEHVHLPDKTTSWQTWAQLLQQTAQTEELHAELSYWLAPARQQVKPLPVDLLPVDYTDVIANSETVNISLSAELTHALLQEVPAVYHTQVNDVLLTALAQAFADWTGQPRMLVDLEGHGREEFSEGVDLSRTVGWFTTMFPFMLDLEHTTTSAEALRAVKEQLRQVPQKGLGYGLLRYLTAEQHIPEQLALLPQAQVAFNYLGQFDASFDERAMFQPARVSAGALHSPREPRSHLLEVSGIVAGRQLRLTWRYSRGIYHTETIQKLSQRFIAALTELITHCQSPDAGGYTPSDFLLAGLNQQQLDVLIQKLPRPQMGRPGEHIEDIYPLSPMQAGLLFHSLYMPTVGVYSVQMGWTIRGAFHLDAWQKAWQYVIAHHPILRTLFVWEGLSQPLQVVYKHVALPWELYDWRTLSTQELQQNFQTLRQQMELTSSALGVAPLLRLVLARTGEQACYFHLSVHHLVMDGWSQSLLLGEVQACYQAYCEGREPGFGLVRPYRDYIAWIQHQSSKQAEDFWRGYLRGFVAPNQLPGHTGTSNIAGLHVNLQRLECSAELTTSLQARTQQLQITLNTLIQGTWALLLSRYSGEQDIVFGATTTGRTPELTGVEAMVGVFINTLPVRIQVNPESELSGWLHVLQSEQAEARQYEHTPLVQIQQWSELPAGQNLFESLVVFQNYPVAASVMEEADTLAIHRVATVEQTHYPLMLKIVPGQERLLLFLQYDETRFEAALMERLLQHLQTLLQAIAEQSDRRLSDLTLLSAQERQHLLVTWNTTATAVPQEQGVHQLFEKQVQRTPEAIALVFAEQHLTYLELDRRANQLAHYLQSLGVGPEVSVGICLEPSACMAIGVLGILKAGGTIVPLDLNYPDERLAFLAKDARISVLLTKQQVHSLLPALQGVRVLLDRDWPRIAQEPTSQLEREVNAEQLLYIIYTSGSTGTPKGVALPHKALINLLGWHHTQLLGQARTLQFASLSFDASFHEMFAEWNVGGTLCIITASMRRDVIALVDFLLVMGIEKMILPVVMLQQLAEECRHRRRWISSLKEITATGEQLQITQPIVEMFEVLTNCTLHNHYGPSESHVVTAYELAGSPSEWPTHPSIGRPIANTQIYVLDEHLNPVPIGVVGELYIGGISLARGYLDRSAMTAERFIPNPFVGAVSDVSSQGGERLYKTGDLVRYRADGNIEFLGRRDHQVKIRGYRIELGEIESLLNQYAGVHEVVVLAREAAASDKQLVAYVVPNQAQFVTSNDLQRYLQASLPDYMVPSSFVFLDSLPLTPNGKVDRWALPAPDFRRPELEVPFVSPRTLAEEVVAEIWAEVLGVEQVGIYDNFFELGGHSLRAVQVISRLRDAFQIELPLRSLFEKPTIDGFINEIAEMRGGHEIIEQVAQVLKEIEQLSEEAAKDILYN